jgi:hypothetical protein
MATNSSPCKKGADLDDPKDHDHGKSRDHVRARVSHVAALAHANRSNAFRSDPTPFRAEPEARIGMRTDIAARDSKQLATYARPPVRTR